MKTSILTILLLFTANFIQLQAQKLTYYDDKFKELTDSTNATYKGVLNRNIETIWFLTGEKFLEYTYKIENDTLKFDTYTKCEYYKNGNISEKYNVVNGKYNGNFTTYYDNGKIHILGTYKNDKYDGLITIYAENGYSNHYMYKDGKPEIAKVKLLTPLYLSKADIKKYSNFVDKIGLIKYDLLKDKSKTDFWDYIQKNNTRLNKFFEACKKETKMAKNTVKEVTESTKKSIAIRSQLELSKVEGFEESSKGLEEMYEDFLIGKNSPIKIKIINDDDINAFAYPDGYIGINMGIITSDKFKKDEIAYFLAHEYSHYCLWHKFLHIYYHKRDKFKMDMIAGISSAAIAAGSLYNASQGVQDNAVYSIEEIIYSSKEKTKELYYKFSREEEFEADAYAMYFLMNQNISPINALNTAIKYRKMYGDYVTN